MRRYLHDHVILIQRPVHRGYLSLPKRVVQSVIQRLGRNPHPARCIAVDHQPGLQALVLLIGVLISQLRQFSHLLQQSRSPRIQFTDTRALQCVLVLRVAKPPPDREFLLRLQNERRARYNCKLSA